MYQQKKVVHLKNTGTCRGVRRLKIYKLYTGSFVFKKIQTIRKPFINSLIKISLREVKIRLVGYWCFITLLFNKSIRK